MPSLLQRMLLLAVPVAFCQVPPSKPSSAPALPYMDWGACPFEGCAYRQWTVRKPVVLYDTWKEDRRELAHLAKGDKVLGMTGVVITSRPGVVVMSQDIPAENLHRGDKILTYTYGGEGHFLAWFKGRLYPSYDLSRIGPADGSGCGSTPCAGTFVDTGKSVWWSRVKLRSGQTGWVKMEASAFDGVDLLGSIAGGAIA